LVIASCDIQTKQGLRDRAIILLLSRLGLRASDVSEMRIDDINWLEATLRVCGKSKREVLLPLPQDVGDALLTYIEKARPLVAIDKLFLCLKAPYRPFPTSSGISSVVCAALSRAGIENPPSRGAHLLRHTAATNMLRNGVSLETVSTVLRHRSLDMTAYYAKIDIPRLQKVAQPWTEVPHVK
jgi:integrase/recombinase XerD